MTKNDERQELSTNLSLPQTSFVSNTTLLYHTRVAGLPPGYADAFEQLADIIDTAAARDARRAAQAGHLQASLILHERSKRLREEARVTKQPVDSSSWPR